MEKKMFDGNVNSKFKQTALPFFSLNSIKKNFFK